MSSLLKNLLGSNTSDRQFAEEMRAVLEDMKKERARCEKLIESTHTSADRLQQLGDPHREGDQRREGHARATRGAGAARRIVREALEGRPGDRRACRLSRAEPRTGRGADREGHGGLAADPHRDGGPRREGGTRRQPQGAARRRSSKSRSRSSSCAAKPRRSARTSTATGEHMARLREQHDRLLDAHKTGDVEDGGARSPPRRPRPLAAGQGAPGRRRRAGGARHRRRAEHARRRAPRNGHAQGDGRSRRPEDAPRSRRSARRSTGRSPRPSISTAR